MMTAEPDSALDNLYPALLECFLVIICGYLAGRLGLVSQQQHGALNTLVGTFSLPSLLFLSLAELKLSQVSWLFLLSLLVSKAIIFVSVAVLTLLVTRPVDPARAGLYAIFCTQSNDFAIGYPIISALYQKIHPDFVSYLYLVAPVNLVILNPFGFVLMEIGKRRSLPPDSRQRPASCWHVTGVILWNIVANPIVFMTALGIAGNFVFGGNVPPLISCVLNVFAKAFPAAALFLLGLRMVGKVQDLYGTSLLVVIMLVSAKLLAMPLVTREVVSTVMHLAGMNKTEIADFSTYGFLYGTIPAAPATFVYALMYSLNADLVASAMVACTFLAVPLLFTSARMVLSSNMDPDKLILVWKSYQLHISIIGMLLCIWVLVIFIVNKTYKKMPQKIVLYMLFSQVRYSYGFLAERSFRMFCLAVSPNFTLIPALSVAVLMFFTTPTAKPTVYELEYGSAEATLEIFLLLLSFIVTMGCLILHQRFRRQRRRMSQSSTASLRRENSNNSIQNWGKPVDNELDGGSSRYLVEDSSGGEARRSELDSPAKYVALLFVTLCSMFVSLAVCLWQVVMADETTAVFIELLFIMSTFTKGQSLLIFVLFGMDTSIVFEKFMSRMDVGYRWLRRPEPMPSALWDDLSLETRQLCEKFTKDYIGKCRANILNDNWWVMKDYRQTFTGHDLVTWLVANDVCQDRAEAVQYGNRLLAGQVIKHLNGNQLYKDDPTILFTFTFPNHN
ncbi:integral membrane protein GPR155-like [Nilaparvata lugens]|uniref:integral membrane protein GPR155-like n=1 Tax=Nilaparvata lugens TaxID=108931 RepID=UPI00193E5DEB|nr:integral membrane protein GPR155-like [Nilaparvata lugens]